MSGKSYEKPLHIDMDFGEALERFARTDVKELPENVRLRGKKKASGGSPPDAKKVVGPTSSRGPGRRGVSD